MVIVLGFDAVSNAMVASQIKSPLTDPTPLDCVVLLTAVVPEIACVFESPLVVTWLAKATLISFERFSLSSEIMVWSSPWVPRLLAVCSLPEFLELFLLQENINPDAA